MGERGEWGFKALKKMTKLHFRIKEYDKVLEKFKQFLSYTKSAVTSNLSEKGINSVLDTCASGSNLPFTQKLYGVASKALIEAKNERVWLRINLKLGQLLFEKGEYGSLAKLLHELHKWCEISEGVDDQKKGSQLVDIYALEIQMYTETKDNKRLKSLYERALHIETAIPHPRVMGIIRECGGKMYMAEKDWHNAQQDFFEAFKSYDEAGSPKRIQCLKYTVLANMLMLPQSTSLTHLRQSRTRMIPRSLQSPILFLHLRGVTSSPLRRF